MVYAIEFLLVFFLPKEVFGGTNKKKFKILGIMVGIVLIATLINVFSVAGSMDNSYGKLKLQKEFILKNPIKYLVILAKNIIDNYSFFFTFSTNSMILQDIYRPNQLLDILYFLALIMSIYNEEANLKLGKLKTFFVFLIGFIIIGIIYTSLYLQFTTEMTKLVGGITILGVQSRYYIPVMLMFLVCLSSKKDTLNIDKNIPYYMSLLTNVIILIGVMMNVI